MILDGHIHYHTTADNIIVNGLPGIFLQHGHMLISRRVKYNFRFIFCKHIIHQRSILDRSQNGHAVATVIFILYFHLNLEQIGFT